MNSKGRSSLYRLVHVTGKDNYLFQGGNTSLWTPPTATNQVRYSKSTREFIEVPFDSGNAVVKVTRYGDLMKECFLCLTYDQLPPEVNNIYDIIKSVHLSIGGQLIEQYSGDSLRVLASFNKKAKVMVSHLANGLKQLMFPLSLALSTEDTHIPLVCLAFHEVCIGVELIDHADSQLKRKSLYINYIHLNSDERRTTCRENINVTPLQYRIFQKIEHRVTLTSDGPATVQKIKIPTYMDAMRELIVLLKPKTVIDGDCNEPVIKMRLSINDLNGQLGEEEGDAMLYRQVIPRLYYDIEDNNELMYIMSFDHTPLEKQCSGLLNQPEHGLTLKMQLVSGEYDVCIMARCFNVLEITHGMGNLKWPHSSSYLKSGHNLVTNEHRFDKSVVKKTCDDLCTST